MTYLYIYNIFLAQPKTFNTFLVLNMQRKPRADGNIVSNLF